MMTKFNQKGNNRFILSAYCPECEAGFEIDLTVMGEIRSPVFRDVSLMPRNNPEVRIGHDCIGRPQYYHKICGAQITPGKAKPMMVDIDGSD